MFEKAKIIIIIFPKADILLPKRKLARTDAMNCKSYHERQTNGLLNK